MGPSAPGFSPQNSPIIEPYRAKCDICQVYKPLRTHHCSKHRSFPVQSGTTNKAATRGPKNVMSKRKWRSSISFFSALQTTGEREPSPTLHGWMPARPSLGIQNCLGKEAPSPFGNSPAIAICAHTESVFHLFHAMKQTSRPWPTFCMDLSVNATNPHVHHSIEKCTNTVPCF